MPAKIPGYTELDESTGLHMTGTPQQIDPVTYRLHITGRVEREISLGYDELRCLPKVSARPVIICKGNFEDVATWAGTPLKPLLDQAGIQDGAQNILLVSADGYESFVGLEEALREDNFLAYEWEGQPLPILHGFPVRAAMPSLLGSKWTKWLVEIKVE